MSRARDEALAYYASLPPERRVAAEDRSDYLAGEIPACDVLDPFEPLSPERMAEITARVERDFLVAKPSHVALASSPPDLSLSVEQLLTMALPARPVLLGPWLRERDLCMLYAWRGLGKTWLSLSIAVAVAAGRQAMHWSAPTPRPVLYIDGEMPLSTMKERLARILAGLDPEPEAVNMRLLSAEWMAEQGQALPPLSTPEGQRAVEPYVAAADLIVLDNFSTLFGTAAENDAESWGPSQEWFLGLRRRGKTVMLVHHASRSGTARGTSKREDVLDSVLQLKRPSDYRDEEGARFELQFTKSRGLAGPDVAPVEVRLLIDQGSAQWQVKNAGDCHRERAAELIRNGAKPADLVLELGVSRATAYRLAKDSKATTTSVPVSQ